MIVKSIVLVLRFFSHLRRLAPDLESESCEEHLASLSIEQLTKDPFRQEHITEHRSCALPYPIRDQLLQMSELLPTWYSTCALL